MKKAEKQIATLLAGTEMVPVPKESLEELLAGEHVMFTDESEEGESAGSFMRRVFYKALLDKSIVQSTMQCVVINVPVGSREMGLDDIIGQFSSYVERWSTGGDSCTMNWGLYEIPNSTKTSITIVANLPIYQSSLKAL